MGYCMPQDGYGSVSAPEDQIDQATDYKPDDATWGEVLVAGAERLNDGMDSDMGDRGAPDPVMNVEDPIDSRAVTLPAEVREQLDRIESAATTAEARTGRIEGTLDDMGPGR